MNITPTDEDNRLERDQQTSEDSPENASRLVGDGASTEQAATSEKRIRTARRYNSRDIIHVHCSHGSIIVAFVSFVVVDGLDVRDHDKDGTWEHEQHRDDAQCADDIETDKSI